MDLGQKKLGQSISLYNVIISEAVYSWISKYSVPKSWSSLKILIYGTMEDVFIITCLYFIFLEDVMRFFVMYVVRASTMVSCGDLLFSCKIC